MIAVVADVTLLSPQHCPLKRRNAICFSINGCQKRSIQVNTTN
jgi:hypothetical protein